MIIKKLQDYNLKCGQTVKMALVSRLRGGSWYESIFRTRKADFTYPGLKKTNDSCVLGMCTDNTGDIVKLPCGHVTCCNCLLSHVIGLFQNAETVKFTCFECSQILDWNLIIAACNLSEEEDDKYFPIYMSRINNNLKQCPTCNIWIEKPDNITYNRVHCVNKNCKMSDFCWECLQPWKGNGNIACGNDCGDTDVKNKSLASCEPKRFKYGEKINVDVPIYRACINCKLLVEHTEACKHMTCKCGSQWCFLCLRKWPCGSSSEMCYVAPRQVLS